MNQIEKMVLDNLGRGNSNAKSSKWFKNNLDINRRELCQAIENLRKQGYPVGAIRQKNGGYYLINDIEDRNKTAAVMRSQAYQMLRVARSIEKCNLEDVEQMEMI